MVRIGRNSACASCGKCGMTENQKHVDFYVKNTLDAQVGDRVELDIPEANSARLALVAYFLPLVPALGADVLVLLAELAGVVGSADVRGGAGIGLFRRGAFGTGRASTSGRRTPTMTAVLPKAPPAPQNSVTKND